MPSGAPFIKETADIWSNQGDKVPRMLTDAGLILICACIPQL